MMKKNLHSTRDFISPLDYAKRARYSESQQQYSSSETQLNADEKEGHKMLYPLCTEAAESMRRTVLGTAKLSPATKVAYFCLFGKTNKISPVRWPCQRGLILILHGKRGAAFVVEQYIVGSVCMSPLLSRPLFPQFIAPTDRSSTLLHRLSDARRAEEACVVTELERGRGR